MAGAQLTRLASPLPRGKRRDGYLKEHGVPHVWNVDDHGHDGETWGGNLYYFAQQIFR